MRQKVFFLMTCLLISILQARCQEEQLPYARDFAFANYLAGRQDYDDAIIFLQYLEKHSTLTPLMTDSLNYLLGWSCYNLKMLDSSSMYLLRVDPRSNSFIKSRFFAAGNQVFLGSYGKAKDILNRLNFNELEYDTAFTSLYEELRAFQLAGISLLEGDFRGFDKYGLSLTSENYHLAGAEQNMAGYAKTLEKHRWRSPVAAGLLSAVVPGAGKIYAGRKGEGIASFLVVAALGLITWENWRMDGPADIKTIIAGSAAAVYYAGGIWGSVYAAQRTNEQFRNEIHQKILLDLHIPLRSIFN